MTRGECKSTSLRIVLWEEDGLIPLWVIYPITIFSVALFKSPHSVATLTAVRE
jgi:hypothetical protein